MNKLNPYFLYSIFFFVSLGSYFFGLSELYPTLSLSVLIFIALSIVFSILIGIFFNNNFNNNDYSKFNTHLFYFKKSYNILMFLIVIGNIANGLYSKGYPLINDFSYNNYGIPVINALIGIISSYSALLFFISFVVDRKHRKVSVLYFLISIGTFILALSRGMIIITLVNCFFSYVYLKGDLLKRKKWKKIFSGIIILVSALYLFGIAGNYRLDKEVGLKNTSLLDSELIQNIGYSTNRNSDSKVLSPLFWAYLYTTSPLANFQNITLNYSDNIRFRNVLYLFSTQMIPTLFGKRLLPQFYQNKFNPSDKTSDVESNFNLSDQYQISRNLNVGTIYFIPYYFLKWYGVVIMFIYIIIIPILYFSLFKSLSMEYRMLSLVIFNTMYSLFIFDNFITFTGLSLQLVLPIISDIILKNKEKRIKNR